MPAFFFKKISIFWQKWYRYSKQQRESCVGDNENVNFADYESGIRLLDCSKLAINRKNDNDVTICRNDVIVNFFDVVLLLLSILVTGRLSFMSISSLVLEIWQFSSVRDWPEIQKLDILSSEFYQISGDWDELGTPNFARRFLMKCHWKLQNARVTKRIPD